MSKEVAEAIDNLGKTFHSVEEMLEAVNPGFAEMCYRLAANHARAKMFRRLQVPKALRAIIDDHNFREDHYRWFTRPQKAG